MAGESEERATAAVASFPPVQHSSISTHQLLTTMEFTGYDSRIRVLLIGTGVVLMALAVRLGMLQLTSWGETASRLAAEQRTQVVWTPAPRGLIRDRNGYVLAQNRSQWNVEVLPADYPRKDPAAAERIVRELTAILQVPMPQVRAALKAALSQQALDAVPLEDIGEDVSLEVVARIEARRLELPGIRIGTEVRRLYPQGRLAAHVLGSIRSISASQYEHLRDVTYPEVDPSQVPPPPVEDEVYAPDSIVGQSGVERLLEHVTDAEGRVIPLLQGRRGYRLYEVNAKPEPIWIISQRKPVPGASVYLTLDSKLQKTAEDALDEAVRARGEVGAAVALDVNTGEVLAMASRPSYDPNQWVRGFTPSEWQALQNDPRHPLINHAIGGCYPPGSLFKMISSCAGFSTTDLSTSDSYTCTGVIHEGRDHTPFRCWKRHGTVDFYEGLAESCDVYFYSLVRNKGLSIDALADYARRFGLGSLTGLGLAGERPGFVPDRRWKQTVLQEPWLTGNTLHFVIGQGYLTVTPLQMACVTAAVANGGILPQPWLVKKIVWPDWSGWGTQEISPPRGRKVEVAPAVLANVRRGMRLAVESPRGTANVMQGLGVPVAGKTGSAEHQPGHPPHAWFVCYAPSDQPRDAICVFVAEGGHGGTVAAPVARKILAAALGLKPAAPVSGPAETD